MLLIKIALVLKIVLTIFWFGSLLFFSKEFMEGLGMPKTDENESVFVFVRLLGAAFLALLVGYILGFLDLRRTRELPFNTVMVGIVSNGLSSLILFYFGLTGQFSKWQGTALNSMWRSAWLTGIVTALLIAGLIAHRANRNSAT